ncbi:MAG: hypothetical protein Ct9H300mP12_08350 [Acidimicrobiales bacterium]|nr:MAG: hypothetical protein Ct9H300mP12_08350 [Acidimicrobiales bacterium]
MGLPPNSFQENRYLRYDSGGSTISAGDKVVTWYISANYDESAFLTHSRLTWAEIPIHTYFWRWGTAHLPRRLVGQVGSRVFLEEVARRIGRIHLRASQNESVRTSSMA